MTEARPVTLYQETRLNLEPASIASSVNLTLPSSNSLGFRSRTSPKRRRLDQPTRHYDEATFTKNHIAIESDIHFRPHQKHQSHDPLPRTILWRILEDSTLLELQGVDLHTEQGDRPQSALTLRFKLPNALSPGGVAFAETRRDNAESSVIVFALTSQGEFYTLTLRSHAFVKPTFFDEPASGSAEWCKVSLPSVFSYRSAFRLNAQDDTKVWASLADGSLVRLQRQTNDDGTFGCHGCSHRRLTVILQPLGTKLSSRKADGKLLCVA